MPPSSTKTRPKGRAAAKAQEARDLRAQLSGIDAEDESEITLSESSGVVRREPVYSMKTGEMVMVPRKRLLEVLSFPGEDGGYRFTADPEEAPEYTPNTTKCIFHANSPERARLDEIGLASVVCESEHLGSRYSQRIHGQNRHPTAWKVREEDRQERKEAQQAERMEEQTQAIRELGQAAVSKA